MFPLSAAGVVDTGGILPPLSLIPVAYSTVVIDTGGKFAAGIVDTGGKIATGINNTCENWWQNLPPVSLITVVRLDLRISLRILEKI